MSMLIRMFLVMFLPLVAFGEESNYWLIHETNLWFRIATSPTIVVGRLNANEQMDASGTDRDHMRNSVQMDLLVEEVIKGSKCVDVLSIASKAEPPQKLLSLTNFPCIFFFSHIMEPEDFHYSNEVSFLPAFSIPATPDFIRRIKEEVCVQTNEMKHFQEAVLSFDLPSDAELQKTFYNVILHRGGIDDIERLCGLALHEVPGLLCLITNDIPLKSTTLSFRNSSENAFEAVAHYEVSSTAGLVSVIADRCLGTGIFSAYSDKTPDDRKHLQNMWEVFVLRWLEQSRKAGKLLRPAIVSEFIPESDLFP